MSKLYDYLLILGDNVLMMGHRLSELCGHGPSLETDIALTNISLDLFGQVRSYYQYAAQVEGKNKTEDDIAMLRFDKDYKNVWLTEQPNTDFAHVICRQFLFDQYHILLLKQLQNSNDEFIAAIANKSIKEVSYHLRFSSEWMRRLGLGTAESKSKLQVALNQLYPYCNEFFEETETEMEMNEEGIGADLNQIKTNYFEELNNLFNEAELAVPETPWRMTNGKKGIHSENLGFILSELQFMQRAYPNMQW